MNQTNTVHDIIREHNGIKCSDIMKITGMTQNSVSGILSGLKLRAKAFNNEARWYAVNPVESIKRKLNDVHGSLNIPFGEWVEGYISGLADHGIINEHEFDELIEYIKNK